MIRHDHLSKAASSSFGILFSSSAAVQLINVFTGVLLARQLGPLDRGILAAAILWPTLAIAVTTSGVADAMTRVSAEAGPHSRHVATRVLGFSLALSVPVCLCCVAVVFLVTHLGKLSDASAGYIYSAFPIPNLVTVNALGIILARRDFRTVGITRVLVVLLSLVGVAVLAASGHLTPATVCWTYLCANLVTATFAVARLFQHTFKSETTTRLPYARLIRSSLSFQSGAVGSWLNERMDQTFVSFILGAQSLGIYVTAVTLTSGVALLGGTVSTIALPIVATTVETSELSKKCGRFLVLALGTGVAAAVVTIPLLEIVIRVAFGRSYGAALYPAAVLSTASVSLVVWRSVEAGLKGIGSLRSVIVVEWVMVGLSMIALVPGVLLGGLLGAALVSLTVYTLGAAWAIRCLADRLEVKVGVLFGDGIRSFVDTNSRFILSSLVRGARLE